MSRPNPLFRPQVQQHQVAGYRSQPWQQNLSGPAGEPPPATPPSPPPADPPAPPAAPPAPPAAPPAVPPADPDEAHLGDAGKRAIERVKADRDTARADLLARDTAIATHRTDLEQKTARIAELEPKATLADKYAVALDKGLPRHLAERLQGNTIAEYEADADVLKGLMAPGGPRPDGSQGPRPVSKTSGVDVGRQMYEAEQAARRPKPTT